MIGLLRRLGSIGGLVALARSSAGQQVLAKVKAYAADPATRRKLTELSAKVTGKKSA